MRAEERALRRILARHHCSSCQRAFAGESVNVLSRRGNVWVVSVRCDSCSTPGVYILKLPAGRKGEGISDLTDGDRERLANAAPVDADDVLDTHQFLQTFNGDFRSLFTDR